MNNEQSSENLTSGRPQLVHRTVPKVKINQVTIKYPLSITFTKLILYKYSFKGNSIQQCIINTLLLFRLYVN